MKLSFKRKIPQNKTYDKENQIPVIRASICTGEQVAGFRDVHSGAFQEVMVIKSDRDLETFKGLYGIVGDVEKFY